MAQKSNLLRKDERSSSSVLADRRIPAVTADSSQGTSRAAQPLRVKIYSDGADKNSMLELARSPLVQGLTTNPTLMRKAGITDYVRFAHDVLAEIKDKPISFEVFADEFSEMERQAFEIAQWGENVYVKIPVTNSHGEPSYELIQRLAKRKVKLNVTALLTLEQVVRVANSLSLETPAIISVFAGRIADTGVNPTPIMQAAVEATRTLAPSAELLWASTREALNIVQANEAGCDIVTVTPDIMKKMSLFGTDLTALSLDTVRMFKNDADAAGYVL